MAKITLTNISLFCIGKFSNWPSIQILANRLKTLKVFSYI